MDELKDKLITIEGLQHFKDKYIPSTNANQIQADWNQTDDTKVDYIKNKPNVVNGNDDASVVSRLNKEYISGGVVLENVSNGEANNGFGIGLKIEGKRNFLAGYKLEAKGNINTLLGNELKVFGNYNKILGRSISIGSAEQQLHDFVVFGASHIINGGYGNTIFGQSHEIDGGRINTIFGSDNTIKGDLTRAFVSGIYNYINISSGGTTDGLFVSGKGLKVDDENKNSYYNGLTILGEYNYCPSNYAKDKILIISNGSSDSNRSNAFEVLRDGRAKVFGAPVDDNDVVRLEEIKGLINGNVSKRLYEHSVTIMDIVGADESFAMISPFTIRILATDFSIDLASGDTTIKKVSDCLVKYCPKEYDGDYIRVPVTFTHESVGQHFGFWTDGGDGDSKLDVTLETVNGSYHILSNVDFPNCTVAISTREI